MFVLLILAIFSELAFSQNPCSEWIKENDENTFESLKNALNSKANLPIKEYIPLYL